MLVRTPASRYAEMTQAVAILMMSVAVASPLLGICCSAQCTYYVDAAFDISVKMKHIQTCHQQCSRRGLNRTLHSAKHSHL